MSAVAGHEHRPGERGAALIIVLGLVALISAWAVTAAYEDMLSLRRAENAQDALQAEQASQSAMMLSVMVLKEDARENRRDDLDEIWAQEGVPFPIDNGMVMAQVEDSNRYINLNNLVDKSGKVVPQFEKTVRALFVQLELDSGLVDALIDWMDADNRPRSGGGEDSSYYDRDYWVKNAPLGCWDELQLIRGFDAKVMRKLASVAVVREAPSNGNASAVNINTAGKEVLMALMPKMTEADAQSLMAQRPFDSVQAALQGMAWAAGVNQAYLSVASDIFMLRTEAHFGRVILREKFMLRREAGKITLLSSQHAEREVAAAGALAEAAL